jgi:ribosomal protein S18 acetylase RimI-like enzyme
MELSYINFSKVEPERLCLISRRIFEDYITGPYSMQIHEAEHILQSGYINKLRSTIVQVKGLDVGYVLTSTAGDRARIASMGFVPEVRGMKLGRTVLDKINNDLQQENFRSLELEVFEQNKRAVALYESKGFKPIRRLFGCNGQVEVRPPNIELSSIDLQSAADLCETFDDLEMPWQISAWRIRQLEGRNLAWSYRKKALVVASKPQASKISLTTIIVRPDCRGNGLGREIIHALQYTFPGLILNVPQLCPEETSGFFQSLGFTSLELNQIQMRKII